MATIAARFWELDGVDDGVDVEILDEDGLADFLEGIGDGLSAGIKSLILNLEPGCLFQDGGGLGPAWSIRRIPQAEVDAVHVQVQQ
jgi:hypothetical protein